MTTAEPTTPEGWSEVPFHGRATEKLLLGRLVGGLEAGVGGAVRIVGGAGSGKTRLIDEALRGCELGIARASAVEAEQGRPFATVTEALEVPTAYQAATPTSDGIWMAVDHLVGAAEARAATAPFVLVLDDLQWSDRTTWLTAAALARRAPAAGFLLITSHRPLPAREVPPVPPTALGECIELGPLAPEDARAIAASVLGTSLPTEGVELVERAAGNPFLTIEVARWMAEDPVGAGSLGGVDAPELPDLMVASIMNRVGTLDPTATDVLRAAAILGRPTHLGELSILSGHPVELVASAVENAAAARLLVDEPTGVAFRHDLIASAIRATTPPSTVHAHLRAIASKQVASPWVAAQLAELTGPGDHRAAAVILEAAGAPEVAPDVSARLLEHVLRIGPPPGIAERTVETDLVTSLARAGDLEVASTRGHELLEPSPGEDPSPRLTAELRRIVARIDLGLGRMDAAVAAGRMLVEEDDVFGQRARSDLLLTEVLTLRRPSAADDARALSRATADPTARCNSELAVAVRAMRAGRSDEAVQAATAAVAQVAFEPSLTAEVHPEVFLANALFYGERFEETEVALRHARDAAQRAGVVWPIPHHLALVTGDCLRKGDLDGAALAAREAAEWAVDTGQRIGATWPHVFEVIIAVHRGDAEEASVALKRAEADLADGHWQGTEAIPWAAALVAELRGDLDEAVERLVPIVELAAAVGWTIRVPLLAPEVTRMAWLRRDDGVVSRMTDLSVACASTGTVEAEAAALRCRGMSGDDPDLLSRAADRYASIGSVVQAGSALAEASLVAARAGDHDLAVQLFESGARSQLEAVGALGVLERTSRTLPVRVRRRLGRSVPRPSTGEGSLTPAERRVCRLVSGGATNIEIADALSVSRRTVESHLSRAYRKLDVRSRSGLAALRLFEGS